MCELLKHTASATSYRICFDDLDSKDELGLRPVPAPEVPLRWSASGLQPLSIRWAALLLSAHPHESGDVSLASAISDCAAQALADKA
jgi:hypothetical protein